jgi:surfeit locus 1 family protein
MTDRLRKARLFWPTLAALAGLAVLFGLGTWQMERKRWKEELIAKIAARVHADPVPLASLKADSASKDLEYTHVSVSGHFLHDKELYLFAPTTAGPGWHVYTPLQMTDGTSLVWVNRGFVPEVRKAPGLRHKGQVAGEVEVRGLVRLKTGPSLFAAENDPAHNVWYWPDITAMTAAAFPGGPEAVRVLPLIIDADARPAPPGSLPMGGVTRLDIPNRHLEYALTWYGLAATLAGVYLTFAISRLRSVV